VPGRQEWTRRQLADGAEERGLSVTERLITAWVQNGLLDQPRRRGTGRGSKPAVWSDHQANLFFALLGHRDRYRISDLTNIPIWLWLNYGDDYVPTRQVRRALRTYATSALHLTGRAARDEIVPPLLDHFGISRVRPADRVELAEAIAAIAAVRGKPELERNRGRLREILIRIIAPTGTNLEIPGINDYLDSLEVRMLGLRPFANKTDQIDITDRVLRSSRAAYRTNLPAYRAQSTLPPTKLNEELINGAAHTLIMLIGLHRQGALSPPEEPA
jgi:hypothetical protein